MAFKTPPGMKPSVVKYNCPLQIYDVIEVFSGAEVLSDAARDLGLAAASLDVVNWAAYKAKRAKSGRPLKCRNGLDLCGPAGFGFLDYIERATGLWSSHVLLLLLLPFLLLLLLLLSLAFHCDYNSLYNCSSCYLSEALALHNPQGSGAIRGVLRASVLYIRSSQPRIYVSTLLLAIGQRVGPISEGGELGNEVKLGGVM